MLVADQVEEVKQKTDIVALVGERVKLSRAGRNFKALCPFHSERTPSFMVSPELGIFKCFGCGRAGDVYTFLAEFDGMEFPEALRYLAERAGVRLEPFRKGEAYQKKERLWEINHLASEYYHYLLTAHPIGERARRYLASRGIRQRAIEVFRLGFAPDSWDGLVRYLTGKKRYSLGELGEVGLVVEGRRRTYDRFRDRVIFPLRDGRGNVIGFAGRVLQGEGERAKYINSPETNLYHKAKHLYGLFENKSAIKRQDRAVVVEGELDAISSWQSGVGNVVAVKGTALTMEQVELIRRYTRNITLALDADTAGDAATKRGITLADQAGMNITIALLVGGKDPDAISQQDPKAWQRIVRRTKSVYDFFIASVRERFDLTSGAGKKQASEELVPVLSGITNAVEQAHYIKKTAALLDVSDEAVMDEMAAFRKRAAMGVVGEGGEGKKPRQEAARDRRAILEEYLVSLLLQGGKPATATLVASGDLALVHPVYRRIVARLVREQDRAFDVGRFIARLPAELRELTQLAFLRDHSEIVGNSETLTKEISWVIRELRDLGLREQLRDLSEQIRVLEEHEERDGPDERRLRALRARFSELTRELSR